MHLLSSMTIKSGFLSPGLSAISCNLIHFPPARVHWPYAVLCWCVSTFASLHAKRVAKRKLPTWTEDLMTVNTETALFVARCTYSLRCWAIRGRHLKRRRWRLRIPPKVYLISVCQNRRRHIRPIGLCDVMNVQVAFTPNSHACLSAILILSTAGNWKVIIWNRSASSWKAEGWVVPVHTRKACGGK